MAGGVSSVAGFVPFVVACQTTPDARPDGPAAATGNGSSAVSAAPSAAATAPTAPSAGPCRELYEAVLEEARKVAACETNADCALHPTICGFPQICYAAHINKNRSTASFDQATGAYRKRCGESACKCLTPDKSVCKNGMCTNE